MSSLEDIRSKIDEIDNQILENLNKRAKLALEVKQASGGDTPIRPEREIEIIKRLSEQNDGPLTQDALRSIFTQIIASFRDQMQLDTPISVSYLGPEGSYSQEAAIKLFGSTIDLKPEADITSVFRSVEAGSTNLAVVPIENSSAGAVIETQNLLFKTNMNIVSEITLPINHCLLSKASSDSEIKKIYAHPQSLEQCRTWLATHLPNIEQIPTASNSAAAKKAADDPQAGAIASKNAASIHGLNILEEGIKDQPGNETRFLALGNISTKPTGNDKTSLICVVNDKPGALYELLGILAEQKISMTRLESHPVSKGQYAFYIDFIGHKNGPIVQDCIEKINAICRECKVLGSYPSEVKD